MLYVMAIAFFALFLLALGIAGHLGLTVDSRDGADWQPTQEGFRSVH